MSTDKPKAQQQAAQPLPPPTQPEDLPGPPKERALADEDVLYIETVERETRERAEAIAAADKAQQEAAQAAVEASLNSHQEVTAAHIEAVNANNQAAKDAIAALQKGKPQQNEELPEPTLPTDLPTVEIAIPTVDPNADSV